MRKAFLLTFVAATATLAIVSYFRIMSQAFPGTYLGRKNISRFKPNELDDWIDYAYSKPFHLKIQDRIYETNLKHLGVLLDRKATTRSVYENNRLPFPRNVIALLRGMNSQHMLFPGLIFSQNFSEYIEKTQYDFTDKQDEVTVDNGNKTLMFEDNEKLYKVDGEHLKSLILFHFGDSTATLEPRLVLIVKNEKKEHIDEQNKKIASVFLTPLEIILQDGQSLKRISLSSSELKEIYDVVYRGQDISFVANESALTYLLDAKIDPLINRSQKIDMKELKKHILTSFESRTKGINTGPLVANIKVTEPSRTHGEIASRYIEIDIGQQKMYLFDGGQMVKSYTVSTGLYYPTPTGHFNIMNKALEGYSDIFNVYMPYWMAFYFGWAGEQDAYFGIHELPYWYAGTERKQRPREFLGSPHTGGCVSLDIGAAKEVYDFSYVGMDVVIFE